MWLCAKALDSCPSTKTNNPSPTMTKCICYAFPLLTCLCYRRVGPDSSGGQERDHPFSTLTCYRFSEMFFTHMAYTPKRRSTFVTFCEDEWTFFLLIHHFPGGPQFMKELISKFSECPCFLPCPRLHPRPQLHELSCSLLWSGSPWFGS